MLYDDDAAEYMVGQVFIANDGKTYQCIQYPVSCLQCAFQDNDMLCKSVCCLDRLREDNTMVAFQRVVYPEVGMLYHAPGTDSWYCLRAVDTKTTTRTCHCGDTVDWCPSLNMILFPQHTDYSKWHWFRIDRPRNNTSNVVSATSDERDDVLTVTMADVCEKFGRKVRIIDNE